MHFVCPDIDRKCQWKERLKKKKYFFWGGGSNPFLKSFKLCSHGYKSQMIKSVALAFVGFVHARKTIHSKILSVLL